jgi:meiosis-specific APC/C activator protein AMA1
VSRDNWPGAVTLRAKIQAHDQSTCGMAWSLDGAQFATGGNDNFCFLFNVEKILGSEDQWRSFRTENLYRANASDRRHSREDIVTTDLTPDGQSDVSWSNAIGQLFSSAPHNTNASAPLFQDRLSSHHQLALRSSVSDGNPSSPSTWGGMDDVISRSLLRNEDDLLVPLPVLRHSASAALQTWQHNAAVKAIAFCPWRRGLVATGGGSNDKMIRFFHTTTGTTLATISVSAQVTSLIWSTRRREIAATFGFAQPDHNIRIAVFSWPECRMVSRVRWEGSAGPDGNGGRILHGLAYPGGPGCMPVRASSSRPSERDVHQEETPTERSRRPPTHTSRERSPSPRSCIRGRAKMRTEREGCLVVACSDETVRFHEVWTAGSKATTAHTSGVLGGSDILEMTEGIDKEGEVIR